MNDETLPSEGEIVAEIQNMVAVILSIPAASVLPDNSIWAFFPVGYRNDPQEVRQFCTMFAEKYKIYLTEEEWEKPTPVQLARVIHEKRADPKPMLEALREK